jgi:predicted nucleic acid-binding protein
MNKILVDSSIWIGYFRSQKSFPILDDLILENQVCVNDLILAELLPCLYTKKEYEVIESLKTIEKTVMNINWEIIIRMQSENLKNGINKVGIPNLIILQNVIQNNLILFSEDRHFELMKNFFEFRLLGYREKLI